MDGNSLAGLMLMMFARLMLNVRVSGSSDARQRCVQWAADAHDARGRGLGCHSVGLLMLMMLACVARHAKAPGG